MDAVGRALDCNDMREAHQAALCRCIICLPGVTKHRRGRTCKDEASVFVSRHHPVSRLADVEGSLEMHVHDRIDLTVTQILKPVVAQKPCVVDDDVDASEGIECRAHDRFTTGSRGHTVMAGYRLTTGTADCINHGIGRSV